MNLILIDIYGITYLAMILKSISLVNRIESHMYKKKDEWILNDK